MSKRQQAGFTIIELLIATMVFSMILVILTVGVISFTRSYYRGVTASATQRVARTTIDEITQSVQFSGQKVSTLTPYSASPTGPKSSGFCIGGQRYSYLPGWQLKDGVKDLANYQNKYVFIRDTPGAGCADNALTKPQDLYGSPLEPGSGSVELLSPNMRVNVANISQGAGDANLWKMDLRIIYGDADLLDAPGAPGGWSEARKATAPNATCRNATAGTQFCAVSQLSTTIQRRVN